MDEEKTTEGEIISIPSDPESTTDGLTIEAAPEEVVVEEEKAAE